MPGLIKLLQGRSVGLEKAIKNLRVNWGRKVLANDNNGESIQLGHYSDSDYEQASGISKRQVEKKIHEIAKKVDRMWQVDKSVLEKYKILSPPSNKFDLSKIMDVLPQNKHQDCLLIHPHVLKENLTLNKTKGTDKQDEPCSPSRKRLKLTEIPSSLVMT